MRRVHSFVKNYKHKRNKQNYDFEILCGNITMYKWKFLYVSVLKDCCLQAAVFVMHGNAATQRKRKEKKMKQRKLILILAIVLSVAIAAGGTMAYLQDTDEDVNVMTLGNVYITQNEQERNDEGDLVQFTQAKPMYPAVYEGDSYPADLPENWPVANDGAWEMTEQNENVIDKIVTVTNTGKSPAYVRTYIAFEGIGEYGPEGGCVHINTNGSNVGDEIAAELVGTTQVDGVDYTVYAYTYLQPLDPGETTIPSLKQVYLDKNAGNEEVAHYGETYDILVYSQAVQTEGFADAQTALDEAFGKTTEAEILWGELKRPIIVYTTDELREAMKLQDVEIFLGADLLVDDDRGTGYCYYAKYDNVINLNGHDIEVNLPGKEFYGIFYALNGAQLDIVGDGDITISGGVGPFVWCTGASGDTQVNIYGGNWTQNSPDFFGNDYCEGLYANREGEVNIYGGTYDWGEYAKYTANESRDGIVSVYGGSFVNFDPQVSHDTDGSYVAEGHVVVSENQENGDVLYTVVKK